MMTLKPMSKRLQQVRVSAIQIDGEGKIWEKDQVLVVLGSTPTTIKFVTVNGADFVYRTDWYIGIEEFMGFFKPRGT